MKKRILSLLLAVLMVVSLLPVTVYAAEATCDCDLTEGVHAATCPNYVCPDCGTAGWHEVCPESGEGTEEEPGTGEDTEETTVCEVCGNDPCTCEGTGEDSGEEPGEEPGEDSGEEPGEDSGEDPGEDSGEDPGEGTEETTVCEVCGNEVCTCEGTGEDSGEEPGEGTEETTVCEICGNDPCTCESIGEEPSDNCPYCEYTLAEDGTVIHSEICNAAYVYDGTADMGKYVQLIPEVAEEGVSVSGDPLTDEGIWFFYDEFGEGTVMKITDWYWDPDTTGLWYRVELYSGSFPESTEDYTWPETPWILQDYTDFTYEYDAALEFVSITCDICGEEGCTKEHILCDHCGQYDCEIQHTYCGVCGTLDCETEHVYCEVCQRFDCGLEHEPDEEEDYTPPTAPVIPDDPQLPGEYDVALVDGDGNSVDWESGLTLGWNEKASLSAWSALGEEVSYQWQIYVDYDGGFWVDITGQTGKGLLFSRAMLTSVLDESGSAWLRCVTETESDLLISDPVRVTLASEEGDSSGTEEEPLSPTLLTFGRSRLFAMSRGIALAALDTVTITIHYREIGGGEIAGMNPYRATILAGTEFNQTILLPSRPGYAPYRDADGDGKVWTAEGYYDIEEGKFVEDTSGTSESAETITLNLSAAETTEDKEYDVYYLPIKVNVGVRYFFQNINDDGYTEKTEYYYSTYLRTGTTVTNDDLEGFLVEQIGGPLLGFTRMVHNDEPVAADGSTIFECYYDRQYYMIHFSLGGGYGVEPVYARYETPIAVPDPTRPGYTFEGWELVSTDLEEGVDVGSIPTNALPTAVPAGDVYYAALWKVNPAGVNYTVVYWRENADPNPDGTYGYSVWGTVVHENEAQAGMRVSGSDNVPADIHNNEDDFFTYNDALTDKDVEVAGDGSTVVNVYYTRNTYTIQFTGYGTCCLTEHTHGTGCNTALICPLEEHVHGSECGELVLSCGREEHTAHTDECLTCEEEEHTHIYLSCYTNNTLPEADDRTGDIGDAYNSLTYRVSNPQNGYVYKMRYRPNNYGSYTYYNFFYFNNTWYYLGTGNSYSGIGRSGSLNNPNSNTPNSVAATASNCGMEEHTHTAECYKDTLHTHSDSCYSYTNCDKVAHTHSDSCYSDCTLIAHSHDNTCTANRTGNIVYVLTAKYDADISALWPTYDVLASSSGHYKDTDGNVEDAGGDRFRGWRIGSSTTVNTSKRVNMTSDLCDTSGGLMNATAVYGYTYYVHLYYMFESIDQTSPANGTTRRQYTYNGVTKYYDSDEAYRQDVYGGSYDFSLKEITGMVALDGDPERITNSEYNDFLYYDRLSHTLKFQSMDDVESEPVKYGERLEGYAYPGGVLRKPDYPDLEPGAYEFAGWYTSSDCLDGTEADADYFALETTTMPNSDMTFFAKWVPVERTVTFFRHYEYLEAWLAAPEGDARDALTAELTAKDGMASTTVLHGQLVDGETEERVLEWTYQLGDVGEVERVGFFYLEEGEKRAFSPQSIPVTKDLVVYAEWRGQEEQPWKVEYVLKGTNTPVAAPDSGFSRIGVLHTFFAKAADQLYSGYRERFFPVVASHSMVMKGEENKDVPVNNVYRFEYVEVQNVRYTIRYLEAGTNQPLAEDDTGTTDNAIVTVPYQPITIDGNNYVPDAFYKQLVLSVKEDGNGNFVGDDEANVITFYYTKSETQAPYAVHYMLQKLNGDAVDFKIDGTGGYEEDLNRLDDGIGEIDGTVAITPAEIAGFEPVRGTYLSSTGASGQTVPLTGGTYTIKVTKEGAHLYIFYQRRSIPYTVHYYKEGTTTSVITPSKSGTAPYGSTVTEVAPRYTSDKLYMLIGESARDVVIQTGENKIIFYYQEIRYQADYIAVSPEGGGFNPNQESASGNIPFTGTVPVASPNYEFAGWYLDPECTEPVTDEFATVNKETDVLIPVLRTDDKGDPITEYVFYAKFNLLAADFTITRTNAEPGQVFVYWVMGSGLTIEVTIEGNGSVTIADLPFGTYTVTQLNDWSWRYSDAAQTNVNHSAVDGVTFGDDVTNTKWLSGNSTRVHNVYAPAVVYGGKSDEDEEGAE